MDIYPIYCVQGSNISCVFGSLRFGRECNFQYQYCLDAIHHSEVWLRVGNICGERLTLFMPQDDVPL